MDYLGHQLAVQEEKHVLRGVMRRRLAELTPAARHSRSEELVRRLTTLPLWKNARRVLLFAATASEPDIDLLWHKGLLGGKEGVYPIVVGQGLILQRVCDLEALHPVPPWSLREPVPDPGAQVALDAVDLALVPALAFDGRGGRLGRGGGFYDRLLATRRQHLPAAIGVGFGFQRIDPWPLAAHDELLDELVLG